MLVTFCTNNDKRTLEFIQYEASFDRIQDYRSYKFSFSGPIARKIIYTALNNFNMGLCYYVTLVDGEQIIILEDAYLTELLEKPIVGVSRDDAVNYEFIFNCGKLEIRQEKENFLE